MKGQKIRYDSVALGNYMNAVMMEINREESIKYQNFYEESNQLSIDSLYSLLEEQSMEHYGNSKYTSFRYPPQVAIIRTEWE